MEFVGVALVLGGHLYFTKSDVSAGLRHFFEWQQKPSELSEQRLQRQHKEDLLAACAENISNANKLCLHFAVMNVCSSVHTISRQWNFNSFCTFLASILVYLIHAAFEHVRVTAVHIRIISSLFLVCQNLFVLSLWNETNLELVLCCEKIVGFGVIMVSFMTLDCKVALPAHFFSAVVFTYKHWQIVGFETVTPMMVNISISWNLALGIIIVLMLRTIDASVAAKRESHDASSLMLGFQKILRGVCDGDVVLQKSSCTIVEDAACLERLLKSSRNLQNTNFLDLFLDVQSRDAFLKFLSVEDAENAGTTTIPRGLRVSLQGANGPVSMDLFHTKVPRDGGSTGSSDYILLAMKEDADQSSRSIPPNAPQETQNLPANLGGPSSHSARSVSSVSHDVVEAYEELVQFSLLVNNSTDLLDIQEARLTFDRRSVLPSLEPGMPTLRKFIRPTDWHRIETMIRNVTELPPEDMHAQCHFRHPMLFRLPGQSRSYLRSHETFVTLADSAIVPGTPTRFWVCFACFDDGQLRRPQLQDLEEIYEHEEETCES